MTTPPRHVASVEVRGGPGREVLRLGGVRIPFTRAVLTLEPGRAAVLTITLPVAAGLTAAEAAGVGLSPETVLMLRDLGWTPPQVRRLPRLPRRTREGGPR